MRQRPFQGVVGESEGSLPQLHDSLPDAGEVINDFRSMSGSFMYRHHVEPRDKLCLPREESLIFPLKYIDVSKAAHKNLDVKQKKHIDDHWNVRRDRLRPISISANFWMLNFGTTKGRALEGWGPRRVGPSKGGAPRRVGPSKGGPPEGGGGGPKFQSFCSLLPPQNSFFFLSLGVLSWNFVGAHLGSRAVV